MPRPRRSPDRLTRPAARELRRICRTLALRRRHLALCCRALKALIAHAEADTPDA